MAQPGKSSGLYCEGNTRFFNASLPSDATLVVDGISFHLHKFPLVSRCGRIAKIIKESSSTSVKQRMITFEDFPGGADAFLQIVKFCYHGQVEFTPRNIIMLHCAADYLDMTDDYGEDNLFSSSETFFHKHILNNWKNCILSLQSCKPVILRAEKLQIINRLLNSLSVMACTDPSLFGWPMMMYGSRQSPGGSILWNGINTGANIHSVESDWWFEDVSYLCIELFERLIRRMEARGIKQENLVRAIMYYSKKYLPGLDRWRGGQSGLSKVVASFSTTPDLVDQTVLVERIVELLPEKKGKSFCRFLLGLLRVALILGANYRCLDSLERRISTQLELATLDSLLIPSFSDSDTLYNTDCIERIIRLFASCEPRIVSISSSSLDVETSSSGCWTRVAKLVDNYIAEIASDVNVKPRKIRSLAETLPESSRTLHDGLYRAVDVYFKAHLWLSEKDREHLCGIIDFQKLSIDAYAHASHNDRLPIRVIFQVLFFEQMQLKTALAGHLHNMDAQSAPAPSLIAPNETSDRIVQREGRGRVIEENKVLKVDMERMRTRVGELEEEFHKIKEKMKKVTKPRGSVSSPHSIARRIGCNLLPRSSNAQQEILNGTVQTPRASVDRARPSTSNGRHHKTFSLFRLETS